MASTNLLEILPVFVLGDIDFEVVAVLVAEVVDAFSKLHITPSRFMMTVSPRGVSREQL